MLRTVVRSHRGKRKIMQPVAILYPPLLNTAKGHSSIARQRIKCGLVWQININKMFMKISIWLSNNSSHTIYVQGNDVMSHVREMTNETRERERKTMAPNLEGLEAGVSDLQIMTKIICTLPPSFHHFVSSWDNLQD